jgi:hypothetical protein
VEKMTPLSFTEENEAIVGTVIIYILCNVVKTLNKKLYNIKVGSVKFVGMISVQQL